MDYLVYLVYRTLTACVGVLPLGVAYRLGQALGWLGYGWCWSYRRLAVANLTIAYGDALSPRQIRRLARTHFTTLGANLLASVKAAGYGPAQLHRIATVEGMETIRAALDRGKGVILIISHIGNWELFAQLCQFLPEYQWGTVYQPLGNRYIEGHIQRLRRRVRLFNRKSGFNAPTAFLRTGGALGVLVDQHAGDSGVWAPFFGRLASTSPLAALLALRTEAELVPLAVHTDGTAHWRVVISPPVPRVEADGTPTGADALTARINQVLEAQINHTPADWFWVHNRWKTPRPKFLLGSYKRGVVLPPGVPVESLKPFRILVRSTNWLGDAVLTIPAIQALARGRPDARVTVLAPEKLAGLFAVAPGVADVLPIPQRAGIFGVAAAIQRAGPFDAAVVLPNSLRSALEVWLAGVPRRVGYAGHRRSWLLDHLVSEPLNHVTDVEPGPWRTPPVTPHQAKRYSRIAKGVGAEIVATYGDAPAGGGAAIRERGGWLRLGLCPGAEYGPTKRWLPERFAETARQVAGQRACQWVLFGVEKDLPLAEPIVHALGDRCENLIGKTTLAELIAELQKCHVLLTNDTGTMHLAAWLGVPTVAIFGSTDPVLTGPHAPYEQVRILRHQVECSPCFLRECPLDLRCMKAVSVEETVEAVLALAERPA